MARLRGDGAGGAPLLLLSHTDVVPAARRRLDARPLGGDLADGYVWGRGAIDMKGMVAMEVAVMRLLAAQARAAGRDPATDPFPDLTRDVLFASTADEEAGGVQGAGWLVDNHPAPLAAAGAPTSAAASPSPSPAPALPDPGRRARLRDLRPLDPRTLVPRLHARRRCHWSPAPSTPASSPPALLRSGEIARRLAVPGPALPDRHAGVPFLRRRLSAPGREAPAWISHLADEDPPAEAALAALCTEPYRRAPAPPAPRLPSPRTSSRSGPATTGSRERPP